MTCNTDIPEPSLGLPQEQAYMCANVIADAKEKAIKQAFDAYFERKDWTEEDAAELTLTMDIDQFAGTETLHINHRPMVQFGRMECRVDIDGQRVQCLYTQSVKVLY